jgi:TolB-like protein/DNA-binding winged helix-turn-helix (wHTH) protein/Flp pilus assembly protein TadD
MPANISIPSAIHRTYSFGEFTLDLDRGALLRAGVDVKLRPKSFEVLSYLVQRSGLLVSKNELLDAIWGQTVVTEDSVAHCLIDIRKAIHDQSREMIRTVPRRGYIFDIPVTKHGGLVTKSDAPSRSKLASSWPRWFIAAALFLVLGVTAIWWWFGDRGIDVAVTAGPKPVMAPHSIAVLPFWDMSPERDQAYFVDGISEEILNLLAKVPELRVISRASAFSFKGRGVDTPTIAQKLNVAHILEGSVRKAGNQVRITVQLIEARSDTHLWSETYDRTLDNIFQIQDEIAAEVVAQLKITLLGDAPKVEETDPAAYALYLQARHLGTRLTPEALEQSTVLYQQALAIDPGYAAAWSGLAGIYINQGSWWLRHPEQAFTLAREATERALNIDPNHALAHSHLGIIALRLDRNLEVAVRHLQHALALEPGNIDILRRAADLAMDLGRLDVAIVVGEYVVDRDPVNPTLHEFLGWSYLCARRLDEAIASFRTALTLNPGYIASRYRIGVALLLKGEPRAALAEMQQEQKDAKRLEGEAIVYHTLGQAVASDTALAELIDKYERSSAYNIAYVLAFRGEADGAFAWLDKAVQYNDTGLLQIVNQPEFANIHDDPRWLSFLESIGMSPAQLAAIEFKVTLPE